MKRLNAILGVATLALFFGACSSDNNDNRAGSGGSVNAGSGGQTGSVAPSGGTDGSDGAAGSVQGPADSGTPDGDVEGKSDASGVEAGLDSTAGGTGGTEAGVDSALADLSAYPRFKALPADRSVIDAGNQNQPFIATDATIYVDVDGYHLFFTSIFCKKTDSEPPTWQAARSMTCASPVKGTTAYAFSSDRGYTWQLRDTPVILARDQRWDSGDIECVFVARIDDRLVLFYAAYGQIEHRFGIGAATLELGTQSVRDALLQDDRLFVQLENPLIPADFVNPGAVNNAQEPSVVVYSSRIDLYYVAIGLSLPDLGFVEGQIPTGIGLRRRSFDRQLVEIAGSDQALLPGVNIAEVRDIDGVLHLHYTSNEGGDYHEGERILWRQSTDGGTTWTNPIEVLGFGNGRFDNWGVMAPSLVIEENRVVMFYTAWESTDGPCPSTSTGRVGMSDDASHCLFATVGRAEATR